LETPHYHIRRLRMDEYESEADVPSYEIEMVEEEETTTSARSAPVPEPAAIGPLTHAVAPPQPEKPSGFLKRFIGKLFAEKPASAPPAPKERRPAAPRPAPRARDQRPRQGARGQRHNGEAARAQPPARPAPPARAVAGDGGNARERNDGSRRRGRRGRRGRGTNQASANAAPTPDNGARNASRESGAPKGAEPRPVAPTPQPAAPAPAPQPESPPPSMPAPTQRPVPAASGNGGDFATVKEGPPERAPEPAPEVREHPLAPAPRAPADSDGLVQVETRRDAGADAGRLKSD